MSKRVFASEVKGRRAICRTCTRWLEGVKKASIQDRYLYNLYPISQVSGNARLAFNEPPTRGVRGEPLP